MVRVDIETIVMAAGPVPSLIVLRERCSKSDSPAPLRSLSIQTGSFEAAAISRGIDSGRAERPITLTCCSIPLTPWAPNSSASR